jgi:hypothetical protein
MATSKLALYNGAIRLIGERKLASLTEARDSRRALDEAYDHVLTYCLEQGQWNFAMRSVALTPEPAIEPGFGYLEAFEKPSDWVRTSALCTDEYFRSPLLQYTDEGGYWYSDQSEIYVRYISNSTSYGMDLSRWPATYTAYVYHALAVDICERVTQNASKREVLKRDMRKALSDASAKDAMNEATMFPPTGSWVRSRMGSSITGRRYDRA